jgi:hypothetical protein
LTPAPVLSGWSARRSDGIVCYFGVVVAPRPYGGGVLDNAKIDFVYSLREGKKPAYAILAKALRLLNSTVEFGEIFVELHKTT